MPSIENSLRVLVVDDSRDVADAIGLLVEALGNNVLVTYEGERALDVATEFQPDLILIDLLMPGMNGCELAQRFRAMSEFARTRLVAITGQISEENKRMAAQAGFDAILFKPVGLKEITAVLTRGGSTP